MPMPVSFTLKPLIKTPTGPRKLAAPAAAPAAPAAQQPGFAAAPPQMASSPDDDLPF
ncbi:MAG: hypothetical protein IKN29_06310 [Bacteroidales bacterium]|nr:hypothetical protein [Bacteroidales bacterium]